MIRNTVPINRPWERILYSQESSSPPEHYGTFFVCLFLIHLSVISAILFFGQKGLLFPPPAYEFAVTDSLGVVWGVTHRHGDYPKGCKGDVSAFPHSLRINYLSPQLVDALRRCDGAHAPAGEKK